MQRETMYSIPSADDVLDVRPDNTFYSNESAKLVESRCTDRLTAWFMARKFCRTEQAARHLAEQILAGNLEALAEE